MHDGQAAGYDVQAKGYAGPVTGSVPPETLKWLLVLAVVLAFIAMQGRYPALTSYPAGWQLPMSDWMNAGMNWFVDTTKPFFRAVSWLMLYPMNWAITLLKWLPWPVICAISVLTAYRAGKARLAVFTGASLVYVLVVGLWPDTMNSLALVAVSVPLAIGIGFGLGVLGFFSVRAERVLQPMMDVTQTVPAFAYLLPILILFGFGPVVGLIAGVIYAFPPMVKNTIIGLREVPSDIIESGQMSGATPLQLFFQVRCAAGLRQILLGVNQTTMAALSMIIIASIIGGSADIGWRVLQSLRKADFGESLVSGIVIALLAMILDRITHGLALREPEMLEQRSYLARYRFSLTLAAAIGLTLLASQLSPALQNWPPEWTFDPAGSLNAAIGWFVVAAKPFLDGFKNFVIFALVLPIKMGLQKTISPYTWGFALQTWHIAAYMAMVVIGAWFCQRAGKGRGAIFILTLGLVFYFGLTNLTWPGLTLLIVYFGYRSGGTHLAVGAAGAMAFILLTGSYDKAVLSLQLCGLAVAVSFLLGTFLGIIAAENDRFSQILRPLNDTLQTMPPFVLLIPIIMIFKIGEFSALLAIISYAIVAPIRYTEYGIRNVPKEVVEASVSMGCTPFQLLRYTKIPLAMPNIMLGLNQAIMFGISMLVISALVGTTDLGQVIYVGLSKGNFGIGFLAGIAMAVIAILSDQFCRAWQRRISSSLAGDQA